MFKVTTSGLPHARSRIVHWSMASSLVDDALRDARPCVNEASLQVVGVADGRLVHMFLHPTPDPVVDRV